MISRMKALVFLFLLLPATAWAQNAIVLENQEPGNPPSEWDITGAGDENIQGYATDISVDQGETVFFKVKTDSDDYRLDIYRMGYYSGNGARKVDVVQPSAALPQNQPNCGFEAATNTLDCGNWEVSASWDVPAGAVSGVYLAKLVREDGTPGESHIVFIVRDDDGGSALLFQTSDTTWQAYNRWGENGVSSGYSLYEPTGDKADKVSYNRPFGTRSYPIEDWVFNAEYPMIRWLERNGYDVSYFTNVDTDRYGTEIQEHAVFMSVGHDEYWSRAMRENVAAARDAGVHLAFFSGNEVYWKVRWEDSAFDPVGNTRTLVCYKEGDLGENQCFGKCDPVQDVWTGLWRSGCDFPLADGCEPENSLTGQISWQGTTGSMTVPATFSHLPFWRNTSIATLTPEQSATLPYGTLGYEWDFEQYEEYYPANRIRMSETNRDGVTHSLSLYRDDSGALVFGAGTVQWSWGLDSNHDRSGGAPDIRMQQATVNLFADMGVQPATLEVGLVPATPLTETDVPASAITFPTGGETIEVSTTITVQGTATDTGGAGVALVEVSTDGGLTWHPANGLESWAYNWTPTATGAVTIQSRAMDANFNVETPLPGVTVTVDPRDCPCTIWSDATLPSVASTNDAGAVDLGMKFQTDIDGYITAIRFYKGPDNTGTHTGYLWSVAGQTLLASVTFTGETATGWQEAALATPVAVTANTTYIVSYHAPNGYYAFDINYFTNSGVDNPPLRALADGVDGNNGVYIYNAQGQYPTDSANAANYWVDVRFHTSAVDDIPPTVTQRTPAPSAISVSLGTNVTATFSEPVNPATVNLELRDSFFAVVSGTMAYDAPTRTVTFDPSVDLEYGSEYTASLDPASDLAGNPMSDGLAWTFTTRDPPSLPPDEGPGGPILVIGTAGNPFTRYPAEILRAEGLNSFYATDISSVDATYLAAYDVVILGEMALSAAQVTMFSSWVDAGGNLITLRPDKQLAGLLGLSDAATTLAEGYLAVDTASAPGTGIVGETIQYHGAADNYNLAGAAALATLYSDATSATTHPAVTLVSVGGNGGQAAAFTYDLARSVVYTRQGNPAWEGQDRDGRPPLRANDMFYGDAAGDPQPDWVNLDKVAIPQADEQQRLLANLILHMNADNFPLPRFWYFPSGHKAVVVMTGDEHGTGASSAGRFGLYKGDDPPGCSVADWECVRASTYLYPGTGMSDAQAVAFTNDGFEVALHLNTNCAAWTPAQLETFYTDQLANFSSYLPSIPNPDSERTHCISWSDWVTQATTKLTHGIRMDTNYYFWPPEWVLNRPGLYTGSGMPMRFADLDGSMVDVYQVTTQMTDESEQVYPYTCDTLLDRALGSQGYYGAFCANMHNDGITHAGASAIISSAQARGVPIISGRQLLIWLDARNASSFSSLAWDGANLTFDVVTTANARNLKGMLPLSSGAGSLVSLSNGGGGVSFDIETIKGIDYAIFPAEEGSYQAGYDVDTTPPVITNLVATPHGDGTATVTWTTDEASDSLVQYGTDSGALGSQVSDVALVTNHSLTLPGLSDETTYYFRVTSADFGANSSTEPVVGNSPAEFTTPAPPAAPCIETTTVADFAAGYPDIGIAFAEIEGGELTLAPTEGSLFSGSSLPAGWDWGAWTGGTAAEAGGDLVVDGAYAATTNYYTPGRVLEFVATFHPVDRQHVGFGVDLNFDGNWAIFSTHNPGGSLWARTNPGSDNKDLGSGYLGSPHLYRIEWTATGVVFSIDGSIVHTSAAILNPGIGMRPIASDWQAGDGYALSIDWLRMTPYAGSGSYESSVFGSGTPTLWNEMAWTSALPAGTSLDILVRTGDVVAPDETWTSYTSVSPSGSILGVTSGFIQYRVDLATTDPDETPTVKDVGIWCEMGTDTSPPVITNLVATPGADGTTAVITWTTNEPSDSRIDYGTEQGLLDLNQFDGTLTASHSVALSGLSPGLTYYFTATSVDAAANSATEPTGAPAEFFTPLQPCAVVTSETDFEAGVLTGTYVAQTGDGGLTLAPTAGSEFFGGPDLPADWFKKAWPSGVIPTIAGGQLVVDGGFAATDGPLFDQGHVLEFEATFSADAYQHVGLGVDVDAQPYWAMFSTNTQNTELFVRTRDNTTIQDISLGAGYLGSPHLFRIEWTSAGVAYYIDGIGPVPGVTVNPSVQMRPLASDYVNNGLGVSVDWLRMTPYVTAGSWESPVFDSGADGSFWNEITWTADEPAGTFAEVYVRGGDTSAYDGTWSDYTQVASSGTNLDLAARYIQVEVQLGTGDTDVTPTLEDLTVVCGCCVSAPNIITADASAVTGLTSVNTCATVPVTITRTAVSPVRGYSITFSMSPELDFCVNHYTSIQLGTYLDGWGGSTQFLVTDNLNGTYTVDGAVSGVPCGPTADLGILFTIDVTHAVAEGTGTITLLDTILRDCDNQPLVVGAGEDAAIAIDTVPPLAVTNLVATQALGSPPGRTLIMNLEWTASVSPDAALVAVYRKGFGGYPEYDDDGFTAPTLDPGATPGDAETGNWTLVDLAADPPATDLQSTRDVWSYVAFTYDQLGNFSAPSALSAGMPNYILSDVSDGVVPGGETLPGDGDNQVNTTDVSLLGTYYGNPITHGHAANRLDIGPLVGDPLLGRPLTDDIIGFEDLILFGINFGVNGLVTKQAPLVFATPDPTAQNDLTVTVGPLPPVGEQYVVPLMMSGDGQIQALSVPLTWDGAVVEPVAVQGGELLAAQGGTGLVLSSKPGLVDIGLMGVRERGISGQGTIASVAFRVLSDGDPGIGLGAILARTSGNKAVDLTGSVHEGETVPGALPTVTSLHPAAPNPFNPMTTIAYDIATGGRVSLKIYSFDGRLVRTLVDQHVNPGHFKEVWQGRDQAGRRVSSGAYVIQLVAPGRTETRRMMLLK